MRELYDQKKIQDVCGWELWTAKTGNPAQYIYILFIYGGDSLRDDSLLFDTEAEAIAAGVAKAKELSP